MVYKGQLWRCLGQIKDFYGGTRMDNNIGLSRFPGSIASKSNWDLFKKRNLAPIDLLASPQAKTCKVAHRAHIIILFIG